MTLDPETLTRPPATIIVGRNDDGGLSATFQTNGSITVDEMTGGLIDMARQIARDCRCAEHQAVAMALDVAWNLLLEGRHG